MSSYPFRVQFNRRGRGGRSGPGGKEWAGWKGVGPGGRSGPGGKEWARGEGVGRGGLACCTLYIRLLPRFFVRFFKALSGDRTVLLQKLFNY